MLCGWLWQGCIDGKQVGRLLSLYTKDELEGLQSGAGRPPLGGPA